MRPRHAAGCARRRRGDDEPLQPNPSAVLGSNNVTPLSMAEAVADELADVGLAMFDGAFLAVQNDEGLDYEPMLMDMADALAARRRPFLGRALAVDLHECSLGVRGRVRGACGAVLERMRHG